MTPVEFDSAAADEPGSAIAYGAASPLELSMADVGAEELLGINAELIIENWNPLTVLARNIPFLAWALGVTLWRSYWPEIKKRQWMAGQWTFKAKRGTEAAIRMAFDVLSRPRGKISLEHKLVPPQWPYASRTLTKAELDAWRARMPQLRVYLGSELGDGAGLMFANTVRGFAGDGDGDGFARFDAGAGLYGRKARIHYPDGTETPLRMAVLLETHEERPAVELERVMVPGRGVPNFLSANAFCGLATASSEALAWRAYTYRLDRTYDHLKSSLSVTAIEPGFEPLEPRYMRATEIGDGDSALFCGQFVNRGKFYRWDRAPWLMFDRIFLFDREVSAPVVSSMSFLNHMRLGMPAFSAELMVRVEAYMPATAARAGGFVGHYLHAEDHTGEADAIEGIVRAKSLRDKALVTFQLTRARTLSDGVPLDGSAKWGDRIPATL